MNTDEIKHFTDPLLGGISETKNGQEKTTSCKPDRANPGRVRLTHIVPTLLVLGALAFFLYQAHQQIGLLSDELNLNKDRLGMMTTNLEQSQLEIADLNHGLQNSKDQLASQNRAISQYRALYKGLKDEQQQQTLELEAIGLEKADRTEVNTLKTETTRLQEGVSINQKSVAEVRDATVENRAQIEQTQTRVSSIRDSVTLNTSEIAGVKRSLEREYYNFELQERGGYMKVFDVSLSLKDTDWKKRQFDMYLMADGKILQKKNHSINEPIFFYTEGQTKPYEVVVTRVDKKMVVGYLSVPKG